jgi:formylmethanofuran dehydrogenase subunit B
MGERTGMTAPLVVANVTCLGCGCACDDIDVVVRDGRIAEARNACHLGRRWFGDGQLRSVTRVDGDAVTLDEAVASTAARLTGAKRPLIYLAPGVSCEAQRDAVAIADLLHARLDSVTTTVLPFVLATQARGHASATLGEVRNRADAVVFWGVDVDGRYPRFPSRYAPDPRGVFVPGGRRSRTVIAVDVGAAATTSDADHRIAVEPADELATLNALAALVRTTDAPARYASLPQRAWVVARELGTALLAARYVALVYDAEPDDRAERSELRFEALASLSQSLNERTRCAAIALRAGGNRSGADSVLVAHTGYPCAVDFARGYPRYDPHASSPRDADLVFVAGDPTTIPDDASRALSRAGSIVVGPHASDATLGVQSVVIDTGADGIHGAGTALRTDDVPLPLRASLPGPRTTSDVVRAIAAAVRGATASRLTPAGT